ncbi:M3 family oligoendopeptidase [Paenibacillus tyrfis]|uniref:M3 family oligoendopeptidase n=1 Tax=Paenibacillus tyrfis TaxID=1501230 RepID=UPI00209ECDC4|nr:M3 family oligoendopeptidase [Paenibacillus tyrfis]MCP1305689.1 M3 family oligoendopeptidase [Paenibacillus tyrfis]
MNRPLQQTWDLDVFFPGGSDSPEFAQYLNALEADTNRFRSELDAMPSPQTAEAAAALQSFVELLQDLQKRLRQAAAFIGCLSAQNQADRGAVRLGGRLDGIQANYQSAMTRFDVLLAEMPYSVFAQWVGSGAMAALAFNLEERRTQVKDKLPLEQETLVNDLVVDGYHGWSALYDTIVKQIRLPYEKDGNTVMLSAGQFFNQLIKEPDREKRERLFRQWEEMWTAQEDFCADALNRIAGFRLQLYKHRGWDSVIREPLQINRMTDKTLQTMWEVIEKNKPVFIAYLERVAKLMGVERLAWSDLNAPLEGKDTNVSYDEAAVMIEEQFRRFSPQLADFTVRAFEERWVEAEDRPGKRPGGFCTSFPVSKQSRIFMTYSGAGNLSTLAHELGHAFHQHVMNELPPMTQRYAMNVAETASTFAELIVSDAALKQAETRERKLFLLKDKIQRAVAFFMDIHARFLFETRFYEERKAGLVGPDRLNELMIEAQKDAFCGALSEYHPHFWAAKLHFYKTGVPFYNFPYTFGFLFSSGIYSLARREGESFEAKYIALLQDTGRLTVEQLASKHLGVDLEQPEFWQQAVDLSIEDVKQFLALTEEG